MLVRHMKTEKTPLIHFIITGGTIDSCYDGTKDTVVPLKKSVIPAFMATIRPSNEFVFEQLCMKDSRQLTPTDVDRILAAVQKSKHPRIIITHGTYTMPDTARFLQAKLGKTKKVVVLTGSMIPMHGFAPSDGTFNLGFALGKIGSLSPGVHIAMNGRIFTPDEVYKSLYAGRFRSIFGER